MNPRLLLAIAAILMVAALVFVGCSGSGGPAMPSPATPDRPDPTPIVVENLIIPADEERLVQEDTVFTVEGVVQIDGALIGADASGAGAHGVDITIEAEGDISVTGLVQAGSGTDGASDEAGGDGGSVSLTSTGGSITVGAEGGIAASSSGQSGVHAGDAGAGGNGLLGGPGGQGGSVVLACAAGTLTIHEAPGLFHVGHGGHGGKGVVAGEDIDTFEPPAHLIVPIEETDIELPPLDEGVDGEEIEMPTEVLQIPSHGGNSGRLIMDAEELVGPETEEVAVADAEPVLLVYSDIELVGGAVGGNAGSFTLRSEAVGDAALRAQSSGGDTSDSSGSLIVRGADGGSGDRQSGDGGDIDMLETIVGGGDGGEASFTPGVFSGIWYVHRVVRSGRGGDATTTTMDGSDGVECSDGMRSGTCLAFGGKGGDIVVSNAGRAGNTTFITGRGGDAKGISGNGGNGGDCCAAQLPKPGGRGGESGYVIVHGGLAGWVFGTWGGNVNRGRGGNAEARSGRGGDGGDGQPPGEGGKAGFVRATPGYGEPYGEESATKGADGNPGNPCPEPDPTPDPDPTPEPDQPDGYGVMASSSPARTIYGHRGFYSQGAAGPRAQFHALRRAMNPSQSAPGFAIGGPNHPVLAWLGQSMIFSPDNSRLWVGSELGGMCLYRNPLTNSGDRAPDLELHIDETQWFSIWYEAQGDTLYATTMSTGFIHAWDRASNGNANRVPDRTIQVPGYHGGGYLIGAHGSDTLFMAARVHNIQRFLVFYDAHELDGLNAANRYFQPEGFNAAFAHALSWDATRDSLYYGIPNRNEIHVHENASNLSGDVTPNRTITVPEIAGGDWISGVIVAPDDDLLFVSTFNGDVMVFRAASGLQDIADPARRQNLGHMALGLGLFRE